MHMIKIVEYTDREVIGSTGKLVWVDTGRYQNYYINLLVVVGLSFGLSVLGNVVGREKDSNIPRYVYSPLLSYSICCR